MYIYISVLYKKRGGDVEQIFVKRAFNSKKAKKSIKQIFPADSPKNKRYMFCILEQRKGGRECLVGRKV